ncbi:hypothetical protein [Accumulibacter sp.]|uniref:DUF7706 family protein n=1 Tax=Accumulibacter sp. TaxID=2053492 RepID=UPI002BB4ABCE|nr:hypothetical protein [Accumulibacter sp.]HNG16839.1 hypothetical protein [Accumulibacter sp.]
MSGAPQHRPAVPASPALLNSQHACSRLRRQRGPEKQDLRAPPAPAVGCAGLEPLRGFRSRTRRVKGSGFAPRVPRALDPAARGAGGEGPTALASRAGHNPEENPMHTIDLDIGLSREQALALAQFLKRAGIDDYRRLAVDQEEAWLMLDAGERVSDALREVGIAPR